ncbi:lipoate--protein ligase family protein [Ammoniphilus oxalaticus]|nr:lipoate--protein ligase family protein [Ammoniphilus oxalaticus]
MSSMLLPPHFQIIDSSSRCFEGDIVYPFAWDEVIARKVGEGLLPPMIHLWRHQRAFVLGLRDRRLPQAEKAMRTFEAEGYAVTVRNSGGAAVPLDPGVLNISIICPNLNRNMSISQDFELMYQVIQAALQAIGGRVQKGEIVGSYCPGDYDLSISGRKFCGIAQRRQIKASIVQAFIVITGSGQARAEQAQRFYEIAAPTEDTKGALDVRLEAMASLAELTGIGTVERFREGLLTFLEGCGGRVMGSDTIARYQQEIKAQSDELKMRYEARR